MNWTYKNGHVRKKYVRRRQPKGGKENYDRAEQKVEVDLSPRESINLPNDSDTSTKPLVMTLARLCSFKTTIASFLVSSFLKNPSRILVAVDWRFKVCSETL